MLAIYMCECLVNTHGQISIDINRFIKFEILSRIVNRELSIIFYIRIICVLDLLPDLRWDFLVIFIITLPNECDLIRLLRMDCLLSLRIGMCKNYYEHIHSLIHLFQSQNRLSISCLFNRNLTVLLIQWLLETTTKTHIFPLSSFLY